MNASVRNWPWLVLALVLATACGEQRLKRAEDRLEALRKEHAERTVREVEPLRKQLPVLKARIEASERSRAESRRELDTLREQLVRSWEGEDAKLESLVLASDVPSELQPALESAQKALGEKIRPKEAPSEPQSESEEAESPEAEAQRFITALKANNLPAVAEALAEWNLKSFELPAAKEEPEEPPAARRTTSLWRWREWAVRMRARRSCSMWTWTRMAPRRRCGWRERSCVPSRPGWSQAASGSCLRPRRASSSPAVRTRRSRMRSAPARPGRSARVPGMGGPRPGRPWRGTPCSAVS